MKPGDFTEEILWLEKHDADIQAGRVRIRQALAGGCREFSDERGRVAVVTPSIDAESVRITGFDKDGPYWHTDVSGGECDTLDGLRLVAGRLHIHGFTRATHGAVDRLTQ